MLEGRFNSHDRNSLSQTYEVSVFQTWMGFDKLRHWSSRDSLVALSLIFLVSSSFFTFPRFGGLATLEPARATYV